MSTQADARLARVQDLVLTSAPATHAETITALSELQDAVHELDAFIRETGDLPAVWRRKVDTPPPIA